MPRRNPKHSVPRFTLKQNNLQRDTCAVKQRFPTEKQAVEAASTQMLTDFHLELSVYQCGICQGWHLTNRQTHGKSNSN